MRWSIVILLVTLLSGCGQNFFVGQPRPDQLTFSPLKFTFPKVAEQQLSNGARVYMKEDHELPLVDLTLMVEGGSIYDPLDKTGLSQLFANTLATGGAGDMSPQQLESELEAMAASFNVSSSDYCYQIDLSLHRSDLQRGLQILAMVLRSPRFDQSRFTLAQERLLESIHRKNDEPSAIAHRLLNATEAPGHPFGAFPSDASVMAVTREDLLKLHERYFHPANFWFGVSGEILNRLICWPTSSNYSVTGPPVTVWCVTFLRCRNRRKGKSCLRTRRFHRRRFLWAKPASAKTIRTSILCGWPILFLAAAVSIPG